MFNMPLIPEDTAMDPNLFALNWDVVFEVLITIILLSFILERALATLFESRLFLNWEKKKQSESKGSFKPLIAFVLSAIGCVLWQFDALSIILLRDQMTILGAVITGGVVAGGSKGAIALFHDVLDIKSKSYREMKESDDSEGQPE